MTIEAVMGISGKPFAAPFDIVRRRILRASGGRFWWGTLRVIGFLGLVDACVLGASFPSARAAAESTARRAGEELLRELGPSVIGASQGVVVNGQRVFIAAKTTPMFASEVLGKFERHCREGAREWRDELNGLAGRAKPWPSALHDLSTATTFRMDSDGKSPGQVGCIVPAGSMQGLGGLLQRFSDFARTGDLSKIGNGRLAVVQWDAMTRVTRVVAVWTEGPFSLLSMFPETGDAPGRDSPYAPRPPDARRILSAEIDGRPYAMRVYDAARPRGEILATYSTEMSARGWAPQPMPSTPRFDLSRDARAFEKDGTAVIVAARDAERGRTTVTVLEMGSTGFVRATDGAFR